MWSVMIGGWWLGLVDGDWSTLEKLLPTGDT